MPNFLKKFFPQKQEDKSYFLSLEILEKKIKASSCKITGDKIEILQTQSKSYEGSFEEMIVVVDEIISQLEARLCEGANLNKVILGLPENFTQNGKIKEDFSLKIKDLCLKLSLQPLGFVNVSLAVLNLLEKDEASRGESFLLLADGKSLEVSLIRVGKLTNSVVFEKSGNLPLDLEKALATFTDVEILPSKILIYESLDLEKTKQELMNCPWTQKAAFLHFPKIENLPLDFDIKAVSYAGGSEMMEAIKKVEIVEEKVLPKEEKQETKEETPVIIEKGENFGFVSDEQFLQKEKPVNVLVTEEVKKPFFAKMPKLNFSLPKLPKIPQMPNFGRNLNFWQNNLNFKLLAILGILGLSVFFFVFSYVFPKAKISLLLKNETTSLPLEIGLNPKIASVDTENKQIPNFILEVEEKGSKKGSATGKKAVGDPAKGEVTVYNLTTQAKTLKKGAVLVSPNKIKFSLDSEIIVASSSVSLDYTRIPGKQVTKITSLEIGPEANLGVSQEFSFVDYPTDQLVAKNSTAFFGGTKREILVVAKQDQEKLLTEQTSELLVLAKKDLLAKKDSDSQILEQTIASLITSKKFDKEVGSEAVDLNLDLSVTFSVLAYKQADIFSLVEKSLSEKTPSGYKLKKENIEIEKAEIIKKKDGSLVLKGNFVALFFPEINLTETKGKIIGKSLNEVDKILREISGISGYKVSFVRSLPFLKDGLPKVSANITLETSSHW